MSYPQKKTLAFYSCIALTLILPFFQTEAGRGGHNDKIDEARMPPKKRLSMHYKRQEHDRHSSAADSISMATPASDEGIEEGEIRTHYRVEVTLTPMAPSSGSMATTSTDDSPLLVFEMPDIETLRNILFPTTAEIVRLPKAGLGVRHTFSKKPRSKAAPLRSGGTRDTYFQELIRRPGKRALDFKTFMQLFGIEPPETCRPNKSGLVRFPPPPPPGSGLAS